MKYLKLLLISLTILFTSCAGNHSEYDKLEDHGNVGDKITDDQFLDSDFAVVQFSADWCGWCKKQYPNLISVSKDYKEVDFFLFDVDANEKMKNDYDVRGLPTTIFFKDGKEICRQTGYMSESALETETRSLINGLPKILH